MTPKGVRTVIFPRPALVVTALVMLAAPAVGAVRPQGDGGTSAGVDAISCPSAGNCAAVGSITAPENLTFVVNETRGRWGRVQRVRGLARLPVGGARHGDLLTVSCSSPGDCSAGGTYTDRAGARQAFVVSARNGRWGDAEEVPGSAALNTGGEGLARADSVSCWSAGSCSAVGDYTDGNDNQQVFVVSEKRGVWGKAIEIPGTARLNNADGGPGAQPSDVSCGAPGDCATGGFYNSTSGTEAFVVSEKHGVWGKAIEVPGSAAANTGAFAEVNAVSCPSAGDCTAVGSYTDRIALRAFAVVERNGRWGRLRTIPGAGGRDNEGLFSVSCSRPGDCTAAGDFLVTEKNGVWGKGQSIPGSAALNASAISVAALSCASAGNCGAGGTYFVGEGVVAEVFVISQKNGTWRRAEEIPGSAALNGGADALFDAVSCGAPGNCVAGGSYLTKAVQDEPFIATQTRDRWGKAEEVPGLP